MQLAQHSFPAHSDCLQTHQHIVVDSLVELYQTLLASFLFNDVWCNYCVYIQIHTYHLKGNNIIAA